MVENHWFKQTANRTPKCSYGSQSCQSGSGISGVVGYGPGLGRARTWVFENCPALIGPNAGAKSRFSVSDRVFAEHFSFSLAYLVYLSLTTKKLKILYSFLDCIKIADCNSVTVDK